MRGAACLMVLSIIFAEAAGLGQSFTWVRGGFPPSHYGARNVSDAADFPGRRISSGAFKGTSGTIWLFGGFGHAQNGGGRLNDLWQFAPDTGVWTWVKGSSTMNSGGVYGTRGVAAESNTPGGRHSQAYWTDTSGNLWIFGGDGESASEAGLLNDLWKFDPVIGNWTWISGSDGPSQNGVYGTKGVGDPGNVPGARSGAMSWTDASGDLWLFGGTGFVGPDTGKLNDLWRFNIATGLWTWVSGGNVLNQSGNYGTQGIPAGANVPGARTGAAVWLKGGNELWLFGGDGYASVGQTFLNDLWRYDTGTGLWTWVSGSDTVFTPGTFGTQGVPAPENVPPGRAAVMYWTDSADRFWLFGGATRNDLWRYDSVSGQWAWMKGHPSTIGLADYGVQGVMQESNTPGGRSGGVGVTDSLGRMWLLGGFGRITLPQDTMLNDLWRLDSTDANWTWVSGSNLTASGIGVFGAQGVASVTNLPTARYGATMQTDSTGTIWLHGGSGPVGSGFSHRQDLWRFEPSAGQWTWMKGSKDAAKPGVYGDRGIEAADNVPGGRNGAVSWAGADGSFWIFGGTGFGQVSNQHGLLDDLWKYNQVTGNWTWVAGNPVINTAAVYGTQGEYGASHTPGGRWDAASWHDGTGKLWLFGGRRFGLSGLEYLNDLWRFDPQLSQWAWIGGSNTADTTGTYGTLGVPAANNSPGGRFQSAVWSDPAGKLWLFGGSGWGSSEFGALNDLWSYDLAASRWTWMAGSPGSNQPGNYGEMGVEGNGNFPGGREGAAAWFDAFGELWLFGGATSASEVEFYNDLWRYNLVTNRWTWMKGNAGPNQSGFYGTVRSEAAATLPAVRSIPAHAMDAEGNAWLFSGNMLGIYNNDLWQIRFHPRSSIEDWRAY
jgi:hypothetical protein